jgi:hypothetical protein
MHQREVIAAAKALQLVRRRHAVRACAFLQCRVYCLTPRRTRLHCASALHCQTLDRQRAEEERRKKEQQTAAAEAERREHEAQVTSHHNTPTSLLPA